MSLALLDGKGDDDDDLLCKMLVECLCAQINTYSLYGDETKMIFCNQMTVKILSAWCYPLVFTIDIS